MMTVLHNAFIDEQRRRQVEARHADTLVRMAEDMAPPAQEGQVRLAQIRQAFLTLPEEQRAALHLVTLEGMAYADAAAVLGIPIGTLMSRLGRGRAALRAFEEGGADRADLRRAEPTRPSERPPETRRGPPSTLRLVVSDEPRSRPAWPSGAPPGSLRNRPAGARRRQRADDCDRRIASGARWIRGLHDDRSDHRRRSHRLRRRADRADAPPRRRGPSGGPSRGRGPGDGRDARSRCPAGLLRAGPGSRARPQRRPRAPLRPEPALAPGRLPPQAGRRHRGAGRRGLARP